MLARERYGRATHDALKLGKGDDRSGKSNGTNGSADAHLNEAGHADITLSLIHI